MFDRDMRYLAVSRRWLDDYGLDGQDVIGQSHYDVFSEIPARWRDVHRRGLAGEVVREDRDWFERADGSVGGVVIFTDDVTDQVRAEAALRDSPERLARIVETDASGIVVVDASGTISFANPAVERMAGLPPGSMAGRSASAIAPALLNIDGQPLGEEDRPFQRVMRTGQPVHDVELAVTRPDGRRMPLSLNAAPLRDADGRIAGVVATLSDITERMRAEAQVRGLAAALRELATRVQAAREDEATRIARELHDELGQSLTGIKIDLAWLDRRLVQAADARHVAALRERIAASARQVDATIQTVRRIWSELRPGILDDLGIVAAIEWQAQEFQTRTGIRCVASLPPGATPIEPARATALYRILQEALTNIMRHAGATRVDVALALTGGAAALDIRDNGRGITAEAAASARSIGLLGMRERARIFGGEVTVATAAPRGTRGHAEIPLGT
jgi:PAS domain S-box-containing protein